MPAVDDGRDAVGQLPDSVVLRHAGRVHSAVAGFVAALPLPLLATIGTALILFAASDSPQPRRWSEWGVAIGVFCGIAGALAGLLARWGSRAGRWGDISAGLVLWPASFFPSYALVMTLDAASAGQPNTLLTRPVPSDWTVVAAEGVLLAACFATAWFGTWRWLFVRILGLLGRVDDREVASDLLRRYYRQLWLSPDQASAQRGRAGGEASAGDAPMIRRRIPPRGA